MKSLGNDYEEFSTPNAVKYKKRVGTFQKLAKTLIQ
jgi:hypothetical protein